ncbi:2EXR family [Microdochium nivale]|nr:2EXR family [Microdochium nivale]
MARPPELEAPLAQPNPTFHPFPRLPYELRQKIYLLATLRRVVHVQERFPPHRSYREARRHFDIAHAETWHKVGVHPSVADFAPLWKLNTDEYNERHNIRNTDTFDDDRVLREGQRITKGWARRVGFLPAWAKEEQDDDDDDQDFEIPPQFRPWEATPDLPDLPLHWLWQSADSAWQFQRESQLFSRSPIPALLHVSSEARAVLVEAGYELTFGTPLRGHADRSGTEKPEDKSNGGFGRTSNSGVNKGMTWFNFLTDTLYISHAKHDYFDDGDHDDDEGREAVDRRNTGSSSSKSKKESQTRVLPSRIGISQPWDIAAFLPADLRRVTRLMLPHASKTVALCEFGGPGFVHLMESPMDSLRPLFPAARELFFAEWGQLGGCAACEATKGDEITTVAHCSNGPSLHDIKAHRRARATEPWFATPMQEVDVFSRITYKGSTRAGDDSTALMFAAMYMHEVLQERGPGDVGDVEGGQLADWFALRGHQFRIGAEVISEENRWRDRFLFDDKALGDLEVQWFPVVKLVHVGTADMLDALEDERARVWARINSKGSDDDCAVDHGPQLAEWTNALNGHDCSIPVLENAPDARPYMPPSWDPANGWTVDKVFPPRKERFQWSIADSV